MKKRAVPSGAARFLVPENLPEPAEQQHDDRGSGKAAALVRIARPSPAAPVNPILAALVRRAVALLRQGIVEVEVRFAGMPTRQGIPMVKAVSNFRGRLLPSLYSKMVIF